MRATRPIRSLLVLGAMIACSGSSERQDAAIADAASDASNGCLAQPCTILPQCGCGDEGACDVLPTMEAACRAIKTPGRETAACEEADACDKGYTCVGRDKLSQTCKKFCTINGECGTPRGRCAIEVSANTGIPKACSSNCDPTDGNGALCPSTFKCGLFTEGPAGATTQVASCTPAGTFTQGANCKNTATGLGNDALCAKGFRCVTTGGGVYACRRYCKKAAPVCGAGETCRSFGTPYIIDVEYGFCD